MARELLELEQGSVLALPHKVQDPISMTVAGAPLFHAFPVAKNERRAGYIQKVTPIYEDDKGSNGVE
jgi:flagellar motor switch protein FliM